MKNNLKVGLIGFNLFFAVFLLSAQNNIPIYLDETKPIESRIEDALKRMTLEEKVAMCHAQSKFSSPGVPRLGIPENWMTDGPHGIRPEVLWNEWNQASWTNDSCTAFPALTCLASTWNPDLAALYGKSIGEEARYRNKNVLLGPGVNIYRTPLNGRNFEYMGEDPYLASKMVVPYVQGVQSNGVAACVKHFALNNQETNRNGYNVIVDDRALYEIYLPAFKAAVQEGHAWAIMGSYNLYKNQHCCHNEFLLKNILRNEWGFDGVVVSDWGGVHDTDQAAYNGLDMEFGTGTDGLSTNYSNSYDGYFLARPFYDKLKSGKIDEKIVDEKVRNILRLIFRTNMNIHRPWGSFGTKEHGDAARKIADEGIVLLKNDKNLLPINLEKVKNVLVVGENAIRKMTVGGGSSSLKAKYEITPLEGLKNAVGNLMELTYVRGYKGDIEASYNGVSTGQNIMESRSNDELLAEACRMARNADEVIFIGGLNKNEGQDCEGVDRTSYGLPYDQDRLIQELVKVNQNLVVVIQSGNAVAMPWVKQVPTIVQTWYNGSESGNALADVLLGRVNPSGKLPMTIGAKLNDYSSHSVGEFPGGDNVNYKEGIFVGYRWFDKQKINPIFPFGHGLSYTTFSYGKVKLSSDKITSAGTLTVSIPVKNTGKVAGKEVVQLYVGDPDCSVERPEKELKAFLKIELQPNEEKTIDFTLDKNAFSYFDANSHQWVAQPGKFIVYIGSSSRDIRAKAELTLK